MPVTNRFRIRITRELAREVNRLLWKEKLSFPQIAKRTGISVRSITAITGGGRSNAIERAYT